MMRVVVHGCCFTVAAHLQVRNPSSDDCLDTLGKKDDAPLGLYQCHGQGGNQVSDLQYFTLLD